MPALRCPSCQGPVPDRATNRSFPFCSPRCKAVDLGRWFQGEYRVPGAHADPDSIDSEAASADPGGNPVRH